LDFGSQYTQVIGRRIRELQVYSEIVRFDTSADTIAREQPNGIILSGGPASVYENGAPQVDPKIFTLGIPILGICYGLMQMAHHLGGQVRYTGRREYGAGILDVTNGSQLFDGLGAQVDVWNSHGDEVTALRSGFRVAARTHKAIGDQLTCIFVNNGLLRAREEEVVQRVFGENFHIKLKYVDASDRFLSLLEGVTDPEQKRKIIGNEFIKVFHAATEELL